MLDFTKSADISPCGTYRYSLTRNWTDLWRGPNALFIMLNPSTADGQEDDPTIRRCVGFAKAWQCNQLTVVNLFAYRATDPKALLAALSRGDDAVGHRNDEMIVSQQIQHSASSDIIVAAWGSLGSHALISPRRDAVLRMLPSAKTNCLGMCASGDPRHPLYCPGDLSPTRYGFQRLLGAA
ncbi:DUF1643 domain-containing protein [Armatimonas sp.]|uniref:DUF1643 domain-containing protein n=1 Tax=Armatimonas sp. TaxID=1872638 RepID=UPI00374DF0BF